jgi:hypothetical protein
MVRVKCALRDFDHPKIVDPVKRMCVDNNTTGIQTDHVSNVLLTKKLDQMEKGAKYQFVEPDR